MDPDCLTKIMDAKEPCFANAEGSMIDLTLMHPVFGEIPFTASPHDVEEHGRYLFARAMAGEFGPVAEYVPPPPVNSAESAAQ
jgi:hypothetical protein